MSSLADWAIDDAGNLYRQRQEGGTGTDGKHGTEAGTSPATLSTTTTTAKKETP